MPDPTLLNYVDLSADAYTLDTPISDGAPPATLDGMTVVRVSLQGQLKDGFAAVAVKDANGNIIIVNEGTVPATVSLTPPAVTETAFTLGTLSADSRIAKGDIKTPALLDAAAFASQVEAQFGNKTPIFVTGHSLGGIEAEAEAKALVGLNEFGGGATFGATGLPGQTAATTGAANKLIDYVDRGDPVGNYALDTETLTPNHVTTNAPAKHYGVVQEEGSASHAVALQSAQTNYLAAKVVDTAIGSSMAGSTVSDEFSVFGFSDLSFAVAYHLMDTYAQDLGLATPPPADLLSMSLDQLTAEFGTPEGNPAVSDEKNQGIASNGSIITPYFTTSFNPTTDQVTIVQTGNIATPEGLDTAGGVSTLSIDPSTGLLASAAYLSTSGTTYNATFNETTGNLTTLKANETNGHSYQASYTYNSDGSISSVTTGYSGLNESGSQLFAQTDSVSATDQLSVTISGTESVSLSNAAITLASGANATITGTNNAITLGAGATAYDADGFSNVTLGAGSGNITLDKGTYIAAPSYTDSGNITVELTAGDSVDLALLSINTASGVASVTLTDGEVISLPTITGNVTISAPTNATPDQALAQYLTDLGYTGNLTTDNYNYENPTGTPYTVSDSVVPNFDGTSADVFYSPTTPDGQITGQSTVTNPYNTSQTLTADNILAVTSDDISQDTITGVPTLLASGDVTLTSAELAAFASVTAGLLTLTDPGTYSMLASNMTAIGGLVAQSWGVTTLIGNNLGDNLLTASLFGTDTLEAGNGNSNVLTAGEGVDTISAGNGNNNLFYAYAGLADGSSVTAGSGTGNALYAQDDISGATVTGITTAYVSGITLNAEEFAAFTTINQWAGVAIIDVAGGTYNLAGHTLNATYTSNNDFAFDATSDSNTTITGNDVSGGTAPAIFTADGNGNDSLTAGGASFDTLTANGNGNDTLQAGGGSNDTLYASGNGNDTLTTGDGSHDNLSDVGNGNNTITAGNGNNDTLAASGFGTSTLLSGYGAGDTLTVSNGTDTAQAGNGAGDELIALTGGNTLIGGSGGDIFAAAGGDNIMTGNGADVFNIYDEDNTATGGGGNDTFNLWGPSGGGTSPIDLDGTTINGGGGTNTLNLDAYTTDISEADISNIQVINSVSGLTLDAAELAGLTTLAFAGGSLYALNAASAGSYNLGAVDGTDAVVMTALDTDGGTTLTGNNVAGGQLISSTGAGDVLTAGSGNGDSLTGWGAGTQMNAGSGTGDAIYMNGTGETATGGNGGDSFFVNNGNETAYGGTGNDAFYLAGGTAYAQGNGGANSYVYDYYGTGDLAGTPDGTVTINNYHTDSSTSTLSFGSWVIPADVVLTQVGNDLVATVIGSMAQVVVDNYFSGANYQLVIGFSNGTTWNASTIAALASHTAITPANGSSTTFTTSGDTINGGSSDYIELSSDSAETVSFSGSSNTVAMDATSTDDVLSDGSSGTGNDFFLHGTGGSATLNGSSDLASLYGNYDTAADASGSSGNTFHVYGTGDAVTLNGTSDTANLYGSNESATLAGSSDSVSDGGSSTGNSFAVTGSTDTVTINGTGESASDTGTGSHNTFDLYGTGDTATLNGSNDTATLFGSNEAATLNGSHDSVYDAGTSTGNSFAINGNNDTATLQGSGETASDLATDSGNTFYLYGNNDTAILNGTSDTAVLFGNNKSVYANGNSANVYDGGGDDNNLFILSGSHDVATLEGDDYTTYDTGSDTNNTFNLYGTGDSAILNGASDAATLFGSSEAVTVNSASANVGDGSGTGNSFTLNSSSNTVALRGGSDTASDTTSNSGNTFNFHGSSEAATLNGSSDAATLFGSSETVTVNGASASVNDGSAGNNTFNLNGSSDTATVRGSTDTITLSGSNDSATLQASGGTATINGTGALLTFTGSSSESITFNTGATGELKLNSAAGFSGTVAGMASGDSIDMGNFLFSGSPSFTSVTGTGAVNTATDITVTDGSAHVTLALLNQYANQFAVSASAYTLTADGTGGSAGTLFQLAAGH